MNWNRLNLLKVAAACWAGQVLALPVVAAPKDPAAVNLGPVLALHGAKADDVTGVVVVANAPETPAWQRGLFASPGSMIAGSLGLTPAGDARSTRLSGQALEFQPGLPGLEILHVSSCRAGRCTAVATDAASAAAATFAAESGPVKAITYGDLCSGGKEGCAVFLPSWALAKLLTRPDASIPSFPSVLLVVATADTLILVDPSTESEWLSFQLPSEGALRNRGNLEGASFAAGGRLVLQFAQAGLLLDFKEDLALFATAEGSLWLGATGLGSGTIARASLVFDGDQLSFGASRFLAMGPGFVMTSHGLVRFALQHKTGFHLVASEESNGRWERAAWMPHDPVDAPGVVLTREKTGTAAIRRLKLGAKIAWAPAWEGAAPATAGAAWDLLGDSAFLRREDSWQAGDGGPSLKGVASIGSSDLLVVRPSSDVKDAASGTRCEWILVRGGPSADGAAPAEAGLLRDACGARVRLGAADDHGTLGATTYANGVARFQLWWADSSQ